jgi:hypothetical protein
MFPANAQRNNRMEKSRMRKMTAMIGALALLSSTAALAAVDEDEIQALRQQVEMLTQRLDALERENRRMQEVDASATEAEVVLTDEVLDERINQAVIVHVDEQLAPMSWAERLRWSGDFRYRYESIDVGDADTRRRNRIRARAHLEATVADNLVVGLGLATGGDDPVSTNQTLGGGGSTKDLRLDLAYFDWSGLENTHVVGGKVKNFLVRAGGVGMMWDGDWRPEGGGAAYDNGLFFTHGLGTWIESDTNAGDEFSWVLQGGFKFDLADAARLKVGAGYSHFSTAGYGSFYGDDDDFFGNSFDPVTMTYLYNYYNVEVFAELGFDLADRPFQLFGDYTINLDADENDTGYAFGVKYGNASGKNTWELAWAYERLEKDAVLGLLTDSDFGGGGTNAKGSIFTGAWGFSKNFKAEFTYFLNDIAISTNDPQDFNRLQLDLSFKYK